MSDQFVKDLHESLFLISLQRFDYKLIVVRKEEKLPTLSCTFAGLEHCLPVEFRGECVDHFCVCDFV